MARLEIEGLEDLQRQLKTLGDASEGVVKQGVYQGAKAMHEAIEKAINSLPESKPKYMDLEKEQYSVVTPDEKKDLMEHLGFSKMDSTGGQVTISISFDGYGSHPTEKYPRGLPIALLARSIESGSSVRKKHSFIRKTAKANKESCEKAIADGIEKAIVKIVGK